MSAGHRAAASFASLGEALGVVALFALITSVAAVMQQVTLFRFWDSDHYYWMTYFFATHQPVTAAAPYVYRIGLPWLISFAERHHYGDAYRAANLISAGLSAVLLVVWLRAYLRSWVTRLVLATLFLAEWHGPARFVHYYPMYVDPPMFVFLIAGLIVVDWIRRDESAWTFVALALLTYVGTLVREVMVVVPAALLLASDRSERTFVRRIAGRDRRATLALLPLAAAFAAIATTRFVAIPRADSYTFLSAAIDNVSRKPLFAWVLSWFFTFGPVLAIVAFDWRRAARFLASRWDLAAYLCFFAFLSYVGGTDTERLLLWAMPVVYVLIGRALETYPRLFLIAPALVLAAAQAVSERIFWPIPSPGTNVEAFAASASWPARAWGLVNRAIVVDDFHWNLWSTFGSRPVHALTLAWDLAFTGAFVFWLTLRSRALRPVDIGPSSPGSDHGYRSAS
jgi:hypothetical protein